ncbi:hypothetical protein GCM10027566_26160 [Arachidicoccus ginsenosidivorans]
METKKINFFYLNIFVYFNVLTAVNIEILKGIHPGILLERELMQRKIPKGKFALSINEYPQTINAIIKGKRSMNTPLAIRIEDALGLQEGFFMTLQIYYDIEQIKKQKSLNVHPDKLKFRPALFWDTKLGAIDWNRQRRPVIQRVFERGNYTEKKR